MNQSRLYKKNEKPASVSKPMSLFTILAYRYLSSSYRVELVATTATFVFVIKILIMIAILRIIAAGIGDQRTWTRTKWHKNCDSTDTLYCLFSTV